MNKDGVSTSKNDTSTVRRLCSAAIFGVVRGLASAAGAALVTGLIWWIQSH
ncbi:hypothetical protein BKA00_003114 [Actinomadura coerulea]|uniref:Uncharacterized protein n=1 Tax=Actinomadura coerulea TaxID=46159 RepID=A0A7X0FYQ4_9ACTN|nr:hypothetical protein [Actinomadura coerulea]MBB6396200.1 hypothetical protein [Actinomadura coerulea]GGQ38810.1 hypothetical protein GCM10010187_65850 [Actinomadura coerulea]